MSKRKWLGTIGLGLLFTIGFLLVGAGFVVRGHILDEDTYTSALVSTNAYERAYTEVLADPELAELQDQLLGRLGLGSFTPTQIRALTSNALRWALPPSTLRSGAGN